MIPQVDGKDLWISNCGSATTQEYTLKGNDGGPILKRYKASFDGSLDLTKLREIYWKIYRNNRFSTIIDGKEYSDKIINITFKYSVKAYNRIGKNIYLKLGEQLQGTVFENCIARKDGQIIAVKVECKTPLCEVDLPGYFFYEDGSYHAKPNIRSVKKVSEIRKELYVNGFFCDGVRYVRWKRSSGSARVGKCLFIDEKLYNMFHRWEMCGIDMRYGDEVDLAALQSYIALTSSSMIGTVHIEAKNILVIDDYESVFEDDVVNVSEENGILLSKAERTNIHNLIFDGESLIEKDAMGNFQDKGMILLRSRFFKSCCFSSNIQKWFHDNGITKISQLNGFTLADDIADIKLITTPCSIKYLKFSTLEDWLKLLEPDFGVVKYEKPSHFMGGKLVQTHYQLINSIQLNKQDIQELLEPTFSFMSLAKTNPAVLRYWIKFQIENEIEVMPVKSKTDVIYKMMSVNHDFYKTKLYYDFKTDFLKSFTKDLKCGHVLVNGNYSTICGNPIEMLMQAIGTFHGDAVVGKGCVYSTRFEWGQTLLGSRSPHITMSNVLLTTNTYNDQINTYMNPTSEIVYVNSIMENLLQQLAGSDYDSDSILLTDNSILIRATEKNYGKFKIAVCNVGGVKKQRRYTNEDLADLDIKTSKNLIGDIINLSQELNSLIWDMLAKGASMEEIDPIYLDVCKLSIASGLEIDRAKKEFIIDIGKELSSMRAKYKHTQDGKNIKPHFFAHISRGKGYYNPAKKMYVRHKTSMDYLQQCVNSYRLSRRNQPTKQKFIPFSDCINQSGFHSQNIELKLISNIINDVDHLNDQISAIYTNKMLSQTEQYEETRQIRQEFIIHIGGIKFNRDTMIALLQTIEKEENGKYKRLLFYTLFGYPNTAFYDVIKNSVTEIQILEKDKRGELEIYGSTFAQKLTEKR